MVCVPMHTPFSSERRLGLRELRALAVGGVHTLLHARTELRHGLHLLLELRDLLVHMVERAEKVAVHGGPPPLNVAPQVPPVRERVLRVERCQRLQRRCQLRSGHTTDGARSALWERMQGNARGDRSSARLPRSLRRGFPAPWRAGAQAGWALLLSGSEAGDLDGQRRVECADGRGPGLTYWMPPSWRPRLELRA